MSLNGLDADAVIEAHQSALADPGGWFLLKYANRDTVEVLSRGHGGVAEAKSSVEHYVEKSPLYGMVQYRRKRVLLKYVPEGTSRLLQVRLTVQFQSILDAFPHDTIFSFTAAAELVDSAIGMCTMLLPANPGSLMPSNSSLRQRRLNEISEDGDDFTAPPRKQDTVIARLDTTVDRRVPDDDLSTLPASAIRAKALLAKRKEERRAESLSYSNPMMSQEMLFPVPPTELPPTNADSTRQLSSLNQLKLRDEVDSAALSIKSHAHSHSTEQILQRIHHSRHLSENESASISQWNDQVTTYIPPGPLLKPKKKLAPRPHIENQIRPRTANTYEENGITRPVANLPHTVRVSTRPNASSHSLVRPGSQQSSRSVPARFLPSPSLPPPLPDFGQLDLLLKRPESRQAASVVSSAVTDAPNASPEKLRLMKALQKRKRTQLLSSRAASAQSNFTIEHDDFPLGHRPAKETSVMTSLPSTIKEETAPAPQDSRSANVSSTASPTSIGTMSDDPSTRPSSFEEDQKNRNLQKSPSRDTDSSSTPKAVAVNARSAAKNHINWFESVPDLNEGGSHRAPSTTPQKNIREEDYDRNTNTPTPRNPQTEETASRHDKSTLSWLASDSQLNVLQSLVQIVDAPSADLDVPSTELQNRKHSYLSVEGVGSPMLTTSSMMSDDDPLVQEIRSATVHEATSMSVKRPPLTSQMRTVSVEKIRPATRSDVTTTPKSTKTVLSVQEKSPTVSEQSLSTALPPIPANLDEERMAVPLSKKTTLGQGISQRIKALEDSSRRDTGMSSSPSAHDSSITRSTFTNLMKRTSFIAQLTAGGSAEKSSSRDLFRAALSSHPIHKPGAGPSSGLGRHTDTEKFVNGDDSSNTRATVLTGRDKPRPVPLKLAQADTERRDAVPTHLQNLAELQGSPLDVPSTPVSLSVSTSDKKRFSFTSYRSGTTIISTRKWTQPESTNSHASLIHKDTRVARAPASEASSVYEDKRGSRASRLMKRVSRIGNQFGSKSHQPTNSREEFRPDPIIEQHENSGRPESVASSTLQMIDIGNVNVQFPESVTWKRRFLRIDDQGYLIFTAPTEIYNSRATNRKFHLGDIQEPCLPDSEREQMAWSILLDLRDGNCVQCACESKQTQKKVLNMLLDAHGAYHSLYPDALE